MSGVCSELWSNFDDRKRMAFVPTFSYLPLLVTTFFFASCLFLSLQWRAADAEIKVPSVENAELEGSSFKALGRSVYSHTCYAYCQEFLPS